jgi:hypothetical protein
MENIKQNLHLIGKFYPFMDTGKGRGVKSGVCPPTLGFWKEVIKIEVRKK